MKIPGDPNRSPNITGIFWPQKTRVTRVFVRKCYHSFGIHHDIWPNYNVSPTYLPFGVRSCEVAIIWLDENVLNKKMLISIWEYYPYAKRTLWKAAVKRRTWVDLTNHCNKAQRSSLADHLGHEKKTKTTFDSTGCFNAGSLSWSNNPKQV